MFDVLVAGTLGAHGVGAVSAWSRVGSAACARRLAAMVTVLDAAHAADGSAEREQWCFDNWDAVCAQLGAAQQMTSGTVSNLLLVAVALRDRFPKIAAVFADGLITLAMVRMIVTRSAAVTDPDALAHIDDALAAEIGGWEPMSLDKTEKTIDDFIARFDPLALRRTQTRARGRSVEVTVDDGSGLAQLFATMFAPDAEAFDARIDAIAATLCPHDPRTRDQRRSDAFAAMGHDNDRLACLCGREDCTAAQNPPATGVVVYVIAHEEGCDGTDGPAPDDPAPDDTKPDVPDPDPVEAPQDEDATDRDSAPEHVNSDRDTDPDPVEAPRDADTTKHDPDPDPVADDCSALDGLLPPVFRRPPDDRPLTDGLLPRPATLSQLRPGITMSGRFLPGPILRRAMLGAAICRIFFPGDAPPEPRYRPSKKLAEFVRCRDLTCRFPGCREPATNCDLDHTISYPYGPTQASNLKALCRKHHLLKTFWPGWYDRQYPDGTVEWTDPDGRKHVTTPGSRLLFPELCRPTAPVTGATEPPPNHTPGLTMPRRKTTRAHDRARRIAYERELNRIADDGAVA